MSENARKGAGLLAIASVVLMFAWLGWASVEQGQRQDRVEDETRFAVARVDFLVKETADSIRAQEHIVDLPEDGNAWHLSVFTHQDWKKRPEEVSLLSWFSREPRLISLRQQTHDHHYTDADPLYGTRYKKNVPKLPAVVLQDASGKPHYKVGNEVPIPATAHEMGNQVARLFDRFPRPRPCPKPEPEPEPDETPDEGDLPVIPDVTPDTPDQAEPAVVSTEASTAVVIGLGILAFVVAAVICLIKKVKEDAGI